MRAINKHRSGGSATILLRRFLRAVVIAVASLLVVHGRLIPATIGAESPTIEVDTAKAGATISPFLYGQFIEHLGRCVRDGIWAEKLRDRKFFQEPGKAWQVVKPQGADFEAYQETAGAYAADYCMALWRKGPTQGPCGIQQDGLGLAAGKDYVGYAILACPAAAPPVEIRLAWGEGEMNQASATLQDIGRQYHKYRFRFKAGATVENATFFLGPSKPGLVWIAGVSLMPEDNVEGMRADTLALIKQLNPPIMRWPGGNFVSGYNWRDGIGDRDRRPPRWERAWKDVEDNDFGLDEFMRFCALIGTEPYVAVNTGLGSVDNAADEVEYANGQTTTRMGAERARNGRSKPYGISWWGVGNEMYGDWQLGHVTAEKYAVRHNAFVQGMRQRDPSIKIVGVGTPGGWNDALVPACAEAMDLLSGHHYSERKFKTPLSAAELTAYEAAFATNSGSVAQGVEKIVADFRPRLDPANSAVSKLRLAVDEWGIVRDWDPTPDGPGSGAFEHFYTMADAVAAARAMNTLIRNADVISMANWAQTVNVLGAIKAGKNQATLDPVGHMLASYRATMTGNVVPVSTPTNAPVDVVAAWDERSRRLALAIVHYDAKQELTVRIKPMGLPSGARVRGRRIAGTDLGAINPPAGPEGVTTSPLQPDFLKNDALTLPPASITLIEWGARGRP